VWNSTAKPLLSKARHIAKRYWRTLFRSAIGLAMAASSGMLLTLAFPPYDRWPLIFVGLVPAVVAQHRIVPRRLSGLAFGLGLGSFYWGYFGPMFADQQTIMAWVPLFAAGIATAASSGDRAFHEHTRYRWFVLQGAVIWVGIEAIRGFVPVIGTGGSVAYALYAQPWLIQPVAIFGIFGLGLLIMLSNYALSLGCLALLERRDPAFLALRMRLAGGWVAGVLAALVVWAGISVGMLGQASVAGASVRVAAVQPSGSPNQAAHTQKLFAMTRQAAAQGAQLIVWPEGALNFNPQAAQTDELKSLASETGAYIALGYAYRTSAGFVNEVVVIAPSGEVLQPYGKDHPVAWMGESSLTRGAYPTHVTPFGVVGTIICYDLNFTDTARKMAANGAQIIAVPSNDWSAIAAKQYTNLVMRAVENRVTLIKADGRYDSAIIDPSGNIIARRVSTAPLQTTLVAEVPLGRADAPLIRLGDWVGWLCIVGIAGFVVLGIITARRAARRETLREQPALSAH
jgi:apolipoprotein N-acyltransferase